LEDQYAQLAQERANIELEVEKLKGEAQ
jgi:hypothetical protein